MPDIAADLLQALFEVLGEGEFALHEPTFGTAETELVVACIRSGFVSSIGKHVTAFERKVAEFTGAAHAVAVVNGTVALQLALQCAGVRPGDEVIVPAISFIATANAVSHAGAIPHFVDVEPGHLGVDVQRLRAYLRQTCFMKEGACYNRASGRRLRAVVPVHVFGHIGDMPALLEVAEEFSLLVVEDAAEALGSKRFEKHAGTFGLAGIFSFNGNKIITTGGGGMIVTNDEGLARKARHLSTTAKIPHAWRYEHDAVGFNFRLPNLNAALGLAQLERLNTLIAAKRKLFRRYAEAFARLPGVDILSEPPQARSNFWLQAAILPRDTQDLDAILRLLNEAGYGARPLWGALHRQRPYRRNPRMPELVVSEEMCGRVINLPSSAHLATESPCATP